MRSPWLILAGRQMCSHQVRSVQRQSSKENGTVSQSSEMGPPCGLLLLSQKQAAVESASFVSRSGVTSFTPSRLGGAGHL